jgi:hypothetical protein
VVVACWVVVDSHWRAALGLADGSGFCEVEALGGLLDGSNYFVGPGLKGQAAGVGGGERESVSRAVARRVSSCPVARALMTTDIATWTDSVSSRISS